MEQNEKDNEINKILSKIRQRGENGEESLDCGNCPDAGNCPLQKYMDWAKSEGLEEIIIHLIESPATREIVSAAGAEYMDKFPTMMGMVMASNPREWFGTALNLVLYGYYLGRENL